MKNAINLCRKAAFLGCILWVCRMGIAQTANGTEQVGNSELITGRLQGYQWSAKALCISADGKLAASGTIDGSICVWDVGSSKCLNTLKAHQRPISGLCITADGKRLASADDRGTACVWDTASGELISKSELGEMIYGLSISDDGHLVAASTMAGQVTLIDVDKDHVRNVVECDGPALHVSLNPDGSRMAVDVHDRNWVANGTGYNAGKSKVTFYTTADGKAEKTVDCPNWCTSLRFVDHGKKLQWIGSDAYGVIDAATFESLKSERANVEMLGPQPALPADASFLIFDSGNGVRQFMPGNNIDDCRKLPGLGGLGHTGLIAMSDDGRTVLVGGEGPEVPASDGSGKRYNGLILVLNLGQTPAIKRFRTKYLAVNSTGTVYTLTGNYDTQFYDVEKGQRFPVTMMNSGNGPPMVTGDAKFCVCAQADRRLIYGLSDTKRKEIEISLRYNDPTRMVLVAPAI